MVLDKQYSTCYIIGTKGRRGTRSITDHKSENGT